MAQKIPTSFMDSPLWQQQVTCFSIQKIEDNKQPNIQNRRPVIATPAELFPPPYLAFAQAELSFQLFDAVAQQSMPGPDKKYTICTTMQFGYDQI